MSKKAFTILELLIVIAVIAILVGIALPRLKGMQDEGNIVKVKGELRTLQTAVESYYIHNANTYPSALSDVISTDVSPSIVTSIPNDPFASTANYLYVRGGTQNKYYVIYSIGTGGNGVASFETDNSVDETNPESCIYVSNAGQDTQP